MTQSSIEPMTPEPTDGPFQSAQDQLDEVAAPDQADQPVPAAGDSALASLRDRRQQAQAALHFNLQVPRMDPPVYVRYRAAVHQEVEKIYAQAEKLPVKNKTVYRNALVLAHYCEGVFEVIDGEKVSVDPDDRDGVWPKFDERLAELLGVRVKKAAEVAIALYPADGDLLSTADQLTDLSGYGQKHYELDDSGN